MGRLMRVAITGASGVLGSFLVECLKDDDLTLVGRSLDRLNAVFGEASNCRLVECAYDLGSLGEALDGSDAVVHLAGIRHDPKRTETPAYLENIQMTRKLYEAADGGTVKNVIFASTIGVYSARLNQLPFCETETPHPETGYGESKLACETLAGEFSGLNVIKLRLAQLLASRERPGYMIRTFIDRARRGEPPVVFGTGKGRREYLYVLDAAWAIRAALQFPDRGGAFNVGSGVSTSHFELAEAISRVFLNDTSKVVFEPNQSEDQTERLMDSSAFRRNFGWEPQHTLVSALDEMKGRLPILDGT